MYGRCDHWRRWPSQDIDVRNSVIHQTDEARPRPDHINIVSRLERARNISAADYIDMVRGRARLICLMDDRIADVDVLAWPTTPMVAPTMQAVVAPDEFARKNAMLLRNTVIVNFFDLCAISVPIPRGSGLPTGFMLVARNGQDQRLFRIAAAVERLFAA